MEISIGPDVSFSVHSNTPYDDCVPSRVVLKDLNYMSYVCVFTLCARMALRISIKFNTGSICTPFTNFLQLKSIFLEVN